MPVETEKEQSIKQSLHYGMSKYPYPISQEAMDKFNEFVEICKKDLSKRSGGFTLDDADIITMYIAGNGWSIESGVYNAK